MTRPAVNERHIARTYRSISLPPNLWTVQASGGSVADGYISLASGESVGMAWVPPYDLDPSKDIKFRLIYSLSAPTLRTFAATVSITFNAAGSIAAGSVLTNGGHSYTLNATVTALGAGVGAGAVTAVTAGAASTLSPLGPLTLSVPNAAVNSIAVNVVTQAGVDEAEAEIAVVCNIAPNDGTVVGYEFDRSRSDPLTTPFGAFTPTSAASVAQSSPTGSLTLSDQTSRNWSAGLYLVGVGAAALNILALEIAYVPLTGGVLGDFGTIAEPWV